jgi:RNA polymerase sigma-70 factor, ECF subfamily
MANDRMAEDAFQEIWMRVFELRKVYLERKVGVSCFRALLFRSARNLCLNTIRLERYRAGSSEALNDITASDESNHSVEQQEMKALLTKALGKLPFEQREAFVLHEYSGYSYGEIAEMMATSEVNIKVRAYRARTRLRKVIGSWLGLGEDDDPTNSI